jgi:tRNA (guanine37-N1)-methyltransferase
VDQVLHRIIPIITHPGEEVTGVGEGVKEIPSSFESAGHIAHVNLNEDALPYKYLIGKAILDKNRPKIRLVVNKIGNIENEFRTFPMEIIAAEEECCTDFLNTVEELCTGSSSNNSVTSVQVKIGPEHRSLMEVEMREHGCRFHFDFANVYWNSRLSGEHTRLVEYIINDAKLVVGKKKHITIVADAMAGVGPFAIPLTSPSCINDKTTMIVCHANDLNPVSYEYLQKNGKLNKCPTNRLHTYNLDARRFIHKMNEDDINVDHFIMNLPQLAPEFLDAFRCWKFSIDDNNNIHRPMIHLHCFGEKPRSPDDVVRVESQVQQRCEAAFACPGCFDSSTTMMMTTTTTNTASIESDDIAAATKKNDFSVRVVRNISPRKNMLCVSFRLPLEVGGVEKLSIANHVCPSSGQDHEYSNLADDDHCTVGNDLNTKRGNDDCEGVIDSFQSKKLMRSS